MNINLIPQKFVKNKATEIIIFASLIVTLIAIIILGFTTFFYQNKATKLQMEVQNEKLQIVSIQANISDLEIRQATEIQELLGGVKSTHRLMAPIMTEFDNIAKKLKLDILQYDLKLEHAKQNDGEEGLFSATQESIFPAITMTLEGDLFKDASRFKKEIEKLEWVYDTKMDQSTEEDGGATYETQFTIRILADSVPTLNKSDDKEKETK